MGAKRLAIAVFSNTSLSEASAHAEIFGILFTFPESRYWGLTINKLETNLFSAKFLF